MKQFLLLSFLLTASLTQAQIVERPADPRLNIDSAVVMMDQEKYTEADVYFMRALDAIEVLPADFCFHFGKNSLFLKKYTQSIDWLNKYLELKGSTGQFSKETILLLDKAEKGFRDNRGVISSADVNKKFFYQNTIKCSDDKPISCPVCKGDDLIITIDPLGEKLYKVCPFSTNGVLTCTEFNLLIQGKLKPKKK
ncbi:hypothetical protein [Roseivirga misakiensis]|uniref:Tetratricopeptide repeat protein n=1 Tax=Roseivirga misakiensis TaxID=1563681 RepID=A0A1E5SY96_9BACT|nr:hypothetical protein [Roseivirga misakiensis]OEK04099.1 hypothetical protein BFP71_11465 [Roseivirga misakiensis]